MHGLGICVNPNLLCAAFLKWRKWAHCYNRLGKRLTHNLVP
jgi:hypothetical protein